MKVSRRIRAPRHAIYRAFLDPKALATWLPPSGMRGEVHWLDARPGGGYRMTLTYERATEQPRGKTSADSDTVEVRFVELVEGERIVQAVDFESDDPAFAGTMTITWTFADAEGGTEVTVGAENEPRGIRPEDHELGMRSTLANLAAFVE